MAEAQDWLSLLAAKLPGWAGVASAWWEVATLGCHVALNSQCWNPGPYPQSFVLMPDPNSSI